MKIIKTLLFTVFMVFGLTGSSQEDPHAKQGLKKVIVQEVIQVSSYTYLHVLEDGEKKWLAAPTTEAKIGEVFYYKGGIEMREFTSKELDRTFDEIFFISNITSSEAINMDKGMVDPNAPKEEIKTGKQPTLNKLELSIEGIEGGVRIADLFGNKQNYSGKKIKVKGEVTKFTAAIMGKNWVHFQDGTSFEGAYDLMITTQESLNVGDVVVFEGLITLDKNFGAGYFYEVIMEEATLLK